MWKNARVNHGRGRGEMIYCNQCGTANDDLALYCKKDGHPLKKIEISGEIEVKESQFCSHCGHKNGNFAIYCSSCGRSLEKIVEQPNISHDKKTFELPKIDYTKVFQGVWKPKNLQTAFIGSIIAIVIAFIGSFLLSKLIEEDNLIGFEFLARESPAIMLEDIQIAAEEAGVSEDKINPFGTLNLFMNANLINQTLEVGYSDVERIEMNFTYGFLLFIVIPLFALFIAGLYVKFKQPKLPISEQLAISVMIGIIYGLLLAFISLFAGFDFTFEGVAVQNNFSFMEAIFNGLVLGFFFSLLGSYERQASENQLHAGYLVQKSAASFLKVFVAISVIISIVGYFLMKDSLDVIESMPIIGIVLLFVQVSIYILNMVMFNSMKLMATMGFESEKVKFSLFGLSDQRDAPEIFEFLDDQLIYLYALAVLTAALFVFFGRKIRNEKLIKSISLYSISFAFLFTFITINSSTILEASGGNERGEFLFGFTAIQTFISSLLFSGIFTLFGAKFFSRN
jgi:hypothetical protein